MKRQSPQISPFPSSTQSGFTIIEALLAVIVVTVLLVGIAPVIALSVATRVQARRVELATQAARTYINGVRAGQTALPLKTVPLNEVITDPNTGNKEFQPGRDTFAQELAPPSSALDAGCTPAQAGTYPRLGVPQSWRGQPIYPYCENDRTSSLYCVDFDQDGECSSNSSKDMVIQAFRSATPPAASDDGSQGYLLGVRVYRADAFVSGANLKTTRSKEDNREGSKVATYAGGMGERYSPLVELTTEIRGSETSYQGLCERLGGCPR